MNTKIKKILLMAIMGSASLSAYVRVEDHPKFNQIFSLVSKNNNYSNSVDGSFILGTRKFEPEDIVYLNSDEGRNYLCKLLEEEFFYVDFRATVENFQSAGIDMVSILNDIIQMKEGYWMVFCR